MQAKDGSRWVSFSFSLVVLLLTSMLLNSAGKIPYFFLEYSCLLVRLYYTVPVSGAWKLGLRRQKAEVLPYVSASDQIRSPSPDGRSPPAQKVK